MVKTMGRRLGGPTFRGYSLYASQEGLLPSSLGE